MLIRIISALVGCVIFIPVLIFSDTWAYPVFMACVALVSSFEMLRCIGVHKKFYLSIPLCLYTALTPVLARLADMYPEKINMVLVLISGAVVLVMYLFGISLFSHGKFKLEDAAMVFMTSFYIIGGYTSLVLLRDIDQVGGYVYMFVFMGAWFTDIFAYFTGRLFGKHKLIPDVSPKKTVEGSIGGIVFCVISYLVYGFILQHFFGQNIHYITLAVIAVIISIVSQTGDLTLSQIKRKYGIKDFGKIMPGHGGALDRFDSVLAVSLTFIIAYNIAGALGFEIVSMI